MNMGGGSEEALFVLCFICLFLSSFVTNFDRLKTIKTQIIAQDYLENAACRSLLIFFLVVFPVLQEVVVCASI